MKEIKNSLGYFINKDSEIYNKDGLKMKTWLSADGYPRIRLPSLRHGGKKVNQTVHLIMACVYLSGGRYHNPKTKLQVNHIDGVKTNNKLENLELITGDENIKHAHHTGLYKHDLKLIIRDILEHKRLTFYSIRDFARYLDVSLNYVKLRLLISRKYPIFGRYIVSFDLNHYIKHIAKLKGSKTIYVYDHITNEYTVIKSYSEASIRFGVGYLNLSRKLKPSEPLYIAGYTFSLNSEYKTNVKKEIAIRDRKKYYINLTHKDVGLKRVRNARA